jgi:hypothetical protein
MGLDAWEAAPNFFGREVDSAFSQTSSRIEKTHLGFAYFVFESALLHQT